MTGLSAIHAIIFVHVVVLLQQQQQCRHLAKCDSINSCRDIPGIPSVVHILKEGSSTLLPCEWVDACKRLDFVSHSFFIYYVK